MSDYRHSYYDLPKGYSLDTINGIASAGTAAYGRVAGTQNTHRIEVRNHRLWLIIIFLFHNFMPTSVSSLKGRVKRIY